MNKRRNIFKYILLHSKALYMSKRFMEDYFYLEMIIFAISYHQVKQKLIIQEHKQFTTQMMGDDLHLQLSRVPHWSRRGYQFLESEK